MITKLIFNSKSPRKCEIKSEEYYKSVFQKTLDFPSYSLLASKTPILGIWDDHDYGNDNSGSEFCLKDVTRDIYLDFLKEPQDSERRL